MKMVSKNDKVTIDGVIYNIITLPVMRSYYGHFSMPEYQMISDNECIGIELNGEKLALVLHPLNYQSEFSGLRDVYDHSLSTVEAMLQLEKLSFYMKKLSKDSSLESTKDVYFTEEAYFGTEDGSYEEEGSWNFIATLRTETKSEKAERLKSAEMLKKKIADDKIKAAKRRRKEYEKLKKEFEG